jgi:hypothetical protein
VVEKAWNGLVNTAVHDDGKLGYVQNVGKEPASSQPVTYESTADFGVGAFLLAGTEIYKLSGGEPVSLPEVKENLAMNKLMDFSAQESMNEAAQSVDGNVLTKWTAEFFPQWIEIDLGAIYNIYRTEIIPFKNRAYQYLIAGKVSSEDSYTVLVDQLENTTGGVALTDTFDIFPARFVRLTVTGCAEYDGDWISIMEFRVFGDEPSTGMQTEYSVSNVRIFPNPASERVWLTTENMTGKPMKILVLNIHGQQVFDRVITSESGSSLTTTEINLSGLSPGIYLIKIIQGNHILTEKLILK